MLDFGWSEFFLLVVLAIVLLGPKEIPEILYWLGRGVRRLQYLRFALSQQFDGFMHQVDLQDLRRPGAMGLGVDLHAPLPPVPPAPSASPDAVVPPPIQDPIDDEDSDYYADFPEAAAPSDKVSPDVSSPSSPR